MVRTETRTYCSCCGAPIILVPNDVTCAGTPHRCGSYWVRVDASSSETEAEPKEKKKNKPYQSKPQKYLWREQMRRGR